LHELYFVVSCEGNVCFVCRQTRTKNFSLSNSTPSFFVSLEITCLINVKAPVVRAFF
jgi:hypothetical protein